MWFILQCYLLEEISWKKNIQKLVLAILYLYKLISTFYKKHPKKTIAIFLLIDSILLMTRFLVKKTANKFLLESLVTKTKRGRPGKAK